MNIDEKKYWKVANLTRYDQSMFLDKYRELGYNMKPAPRQVQRSLDDSENDFLIRIKKHLRMIKEEGFDAVLIGGKSHTIPYLYVVANKMGFRCIIGIFSSNRYSPEKHLVDVVVLNSDDEIMKLF